MNSKIKTVLMLTGLFLIIALFWVMIGNILFDVKPIDKNKDNVSIVLKKVTVNLIVENVNNSINYYKEVFRFDVIMTVPDTGPRDFALIKKDNVEIMLQSISSMPEHIRSLWEEKIGGSFTLYFDTENVEEYYNSVKGKCEIIEGMKETFYGTKEFTVRDNNGYLLTFAQEIIN